MSSGSWQQIGQAGGLGPSRPGSLMWGEPRQYYPPTTVSQQTPEQQALMRQFATWQSSRIGKEGELYGGEFAPDYAISPELEQFAAGQYLEPDYLKAKEKEVIGTWKSEVMPELRGEMGKKGLFYGSGRQRAEEESAESLMDVITRGRVEEERYARQQQLGALGMLGQQRYGKAQIEQEGLMGQYQDWVRARPENQMGLLMQMLALNPNAAFGPMVSGRQPGAAQGGAEAILSRWSDYRLKKNIIYLPMRIAGIPVILFKYKQEYISDGNKWHIGISAQDLIRIRPDLVGIATIQGKPFYTVNYKGLIAD